jgi:hypothetical protein
MNGTPNPGQFKPQTLAFSCANCGEGFSTIEELEQHELSCGEGEGRSAEQQEPDEDQ